jgi:hypothetical protein
MRRSGFLRLPGENHADMLGVTWMEEAWPDALSS